MKLRSYTYFYVLMHAIADKYRSHKTHWYAPKNFQWLVLQLGYAPVFFLGGGRTYLFVKHSWRSATHILDLQIIIIISFAVLKRIKETQTHKTRKQTHREAKMVCVPCIFIPLFLYIWHKFLQPIVLKFWNPWAPGKLGCFQWYIIGI